MMKRLALVACAAVLASGTAASAACKLGKLQFNLDQLTHTDMEIGPGEYCTGRFDFGTLRITRIEVPNQPKNGLVNVDQKTFEWKYRPFKQFRGNDFFALKIFAYDSRKTSDGVIQFNVKVQ